jgi:hypothetical protein
MRPPPPDLDAYAAYAIALRYLAARVPEVTVDRPDRPARSLGDHAEGR